MAIKTAFKRSLLNQQPVGSDGLARPFSLEPIGFAEIIERQDSVPEQESIDSGDDSIDSLTTSAGQASLSVNKPEFLALESISVDNIENEIKSLQLKKIETQIERDDYSFVLETIRNNPGIQQQLEKQEKLVADVVKKNEKVSTGLRRISSAISKVRENYNFVSSKQKIQQSSKSIFEQLPQKYNLANQDFIPVDSQLPGIENAETLTTTSRIAGLIYSLLLPANTTFRNNGSLSTPMPSDNDDPVSKFLSILSSNEITTEAGFRFVDSVLPQDPIERINLLAEALSYELSFTKGLRKLRFNSLDDYVNSRVGKFTSTFGIDSPLTTYLSLLKQGDTLPLETSDILIDSATYKGILSGLIDESFKNGDFELAEVTRFSNAFIDYMQNLTDELKILHCLDDENEELSSTTIIKQVTKIVYDLIETIYEEKVNDNLNIDSNFVQVYNKSALVLLAKLGSISSFGRSKGPGAARFEIFKSINLSASPTRTGTRSSRGVTETVTNVTSTITKQDNSKETTRIETRTSQPASTLQTRQLEDRDNNEQIIGFEFVQTRRQSNPIIQNSLGGIPVSDILNSSFDLFNDKTTSDSLGRIIGLTKSTFVSFRQKKNIKISIDSTKVFKRILLRESSRVPVIRNLELHEGSVFTKEIFPIASLFTVNENPPDRVQRLEKVPHKIIQDSYRVFELQFAQLCQGLCLKTLENNSRLSQFDQTANYSLDSFDISFMVFELLVAIASLGSANIPVTIIPYKQNYLKDGTPISEEKLPAGTIKVPTGNEAPPIAGFSGGQSSGPKVICRLDGFNFTADSAEACRSLGGSVVQILNDE